MATPEEIKQRHPAYIARLKQWEKIRDVIEGEDEIKEKGSVYLPVPSGQKTRNEAYKAYKERASFYGVADRTLGGLLGLTFASIPNVQANARDAERKNDINIIFTQLEVHYNEYGEYPTEKELSQEYDTVLPGADEESLTDPSGNFIQQGDYTYIPSICSALGCQSYELSAHLEDGTKYTKNSLN